MKIQSNNQNKQVLQAILIVSQKERCRMEGIVGNVGGR